MVALVDIRILSRVKGGSSAKNGELQAGRRGDNGNAIEIDNIDRHSSALGADNLSVLNLAPLWQNSRESPACFELGEEPISVGHPFCCRFLHGIAY